MHIAGMACDDVCAMADADVTQELTPKTYRLALTRWASFVGTTPPMHPPKGCPTITGDRCPPGLTVSTCRRYNPRCSPRSNSEPTPPTQPDGIHQQKTDDIQPPQQARRVQSRQDETRRNYPPVIFQDCMRDGVGGTGLYLGHIPYCWILSVYRPS